MNGILLIDKPKSWTSRDVVNYVSKKLNTKKIGHTGTLDPMATGLLVVCINDALKLVEPLMNHEKEYIAKIKLGIETDTLDITGKITNKKSVPNITKESIKKVLNFFKGKTKQEVPLYSSIKINGKKLYEYARNNEKVKLPIREIEIKNIELIDTNEKDEITFKCYVSKGTYIRSLARDIGIKLGTVATLTELRRTKLGDFNIEEAYSIKDIEEEKIIIKPILNILNIPKVTVDKNKEKKIRNGCILPAFFKENMAYIINEEGRLLAIYQKKDDNHVKPYRMFLSE